jgi:hypothetical protein
MDINQIIALLIGNSAIFAFIQYLITRQDKKKDKTAELAKQLDETKTEIIDKIDGLNVKIDKNNIEQIKTTLIIHFDRIQNGEKLSEGVIRRLHTEYDAYLALGDGDSYISNQYEHLTNEGKF